MNMDEDCVSEHLKAKEKQKEDATVYRFLEFFTKE
jgi:Fe2+ or Zn2+ uptake regulation protein